MTHAFSNGTEWDAWSAGWCHRCASYERCPIVDDLFMGEGLIPDEWIVGPLTLSPERYTCTVFVPEPPQAPCVSQG